MPPGAGADEVQPLRRDDLRACALLHRELLPDSFFARLGPSFLRSYQRTFIDSPYGIGLTATIASRPVAFLVGTTNERLHYGWVLRHRGLSLAAIGIGALLLRPRLLIFFLRTRARRYLGGALRLTRSRRTPTDIDATPATSAFTAQLTHVAVAADCRGSGVGRRLVERFEHHARSAGCTRARLLTRVGDTGARVFYERLGWSEQSEYVDGDGRAWTRMATLL